MTWDEYFLRMCGLVASKSKDRSTQVGCVIVGPDREVRSTGFNGFPRGADDTREEWHQRPLKYRVTEHSERNAIYNAARHGAALKGCTIYVPWHPCADCARGIIQSGIAEVVMDASHPLDPALLERWREELEAAGMLFNECGVVVRSVNNTPPPGVTRTSWEPTRLRRALKMLLRAYGYENVYGPIPIPTEKAETDGTQG